MNKRRLIKFLTVSTVAAIALVVIVYFSGRWIIGNQYKMEFSKGQMDGWVNEIIQTPIISGNFLTIYDALYSNPEEKKISSTYHDYVWRHLTGFLPSRARGQKVFSYKVSELLLKNEKTWNSFFNNYLVLAYGLEDFVTPTQAKLFYLNNVEVSFSNSSDTIIIIKGIKNIAESKFKKDLDELTRDEILEIIITIDDNRERYDKELNPESFESRMNVLRRIIEKEKG